MPSFCGIVELGTEVIPVLLETKRLILRRFTMADLEGLHAILSDREVMRYIEPPFTRLQTTRFIQAAGMDKTPLVYAIISRVENQLLGHVIWHPYDENSYELGWILGRAHWGQGYASELTAALVEKAAGELHHVVIRCVPEQKASCRIAEKHGFFFLGIQDGLTVYRHLAKTRVGVMTDRQREELIQSLLGKTVDVVIDRPIGFVHVTNGVTLRYTVNYGYLPGILGGDGEEQDVYILGVNRPLKRFRGPIVGVIRRADDSEDKLVAAPEGMVLRREQIAEAVHFVEQYFDSTFESIFDSKPEAHP